MAGMEREPCGLEINTIVTSVPMAAYRFASATARLLQRQQASNQGIEKSHSVGHCVSLEVPLCTVSGIIPFSTAVMQGSVLKIQLCCHSLLPRKVIYQGYQ